MRKGWADLAIAITECWLLISRTALHLTACSRSRSVLRRSWTRSPLRRPHPPSCAQSEERDPWQKGWAPYSKPFRPLVFRLPGSSRRGRAAPSPLLRLLRLSGGLQRSLATSIAVQSHHLLVGDIHLVGDVPALLHVERIHVVHPLLERQPLGRRRRIGAEPVSNDSSIPIAVDSAPSR